jgi:hypothetical protein
MPRKSKDPYQLFVTQSLFVFSKFCILDRPYLCLLFYFTSSSGKNCSILIALFRTVLICFCVIYLTFVDFLSALEFMGTFSACKLFKVLW